MSTIDSENNSKPTAEAVQTKVAPKRAKKAKPANKLAPAKKGAKPTTEEIADAFEGIEYDSPSGRVKLAIGNGHQGIQETAYGTFKYNKQTKTPEIVDVIRFPAECVNPPAGITADDWIKEGMKGAKCN